MKISEIRTGLFGFRKTDVCRYIADLDEQFSARLLEREASLRETAEDLRRSLAARERELAEKENELAEAERLCEELREKLAVSAPPVAPKDAAEEHFAAPFAAKDEPEPGEDEGNLSLFELRDDALGGISWKTAE